MADQSKSVVDFQAQQAGQPDGDQQAPQLQQEQAQQVNQALQQNGVQAHGNQQQTGLTKDEVLDLIKQTVSEAVPQALDGFRREEQSQRDKLETRIRQEVAKKVAALQSVNITPTQEQIQRLTDVATAEVIGEQSKDVSTTQPAQEQLKEPQKQEQPAIDPVTQMALEYMKQTGVELVEGDPELVSIPKTGNAVEFLTAVKAAVDEKAARLAQGRLPVTGGNGAPHVPPYRKPIEDLSEAYRKHS